MQTQIYKYSVHNSGMVVALKLNFHFNATFQIVVVTYAHKKLDRNGNSTLMQPPFHSGFPTFCASINIAMYTFLNVFITCVV